MTKHTPVDLPWHAIDTVLIDLDGTLLDLHYDNHFFSEYLPAHLAWLRGVDVATVRAEFDAHCRRIEGTLEWYCLDYWQRELGLDLLPLKRRAADRVRWRPHAHDFLMRLAGAGKRRVLATNAHRGSIAVKAERVPFPDNLEAIHSAHDLGAPKEDPAFWGALRTREDFLPERTLFVDDNPRVLAAARAWGIGHVVGITRPDLTRPPRALTGFAAIEDFDGPALPETADPGQASP